MANSITFRSSSITSRSSSTTVRSSLPGKTIRMGPGHHAGERMRHQIAIDGDQSTSMLELNTRVVIAPYSAIESKSELFILP